MNNLQQLIVLALPQTKRLSNLHRAELLSTAAEHLDDDLSLVCQAESVCLRSAESHQFKLEQLLEEALQ